MIKIGITGSTGVLGKSLIYHLKKISRYKTYNYKHNILNKKKIEHWIKKNQFQIIIHLAALVPTKKVSKNFKLANDVNIKGTKNLVNSIKKFQNQKVFLFFSSTSHVYSFSKKKIKETSKTKGITQYGKTKILAEKFLMNNNNFYDLCIGRISSLTSENQNINFVIKKIIEFEKQTNNFNFGNSNIKRDFIYVDDISKIIKKIIKNEITGIINISNSQTTHLYKLIDHLKKKYRLSINHFLGKEEILVLSNKLLLKKIGKFKFIKINKIIKKFLK